MKLRTILSVFAALSAAAIGGNTVASSQPEITSWKWRTVRVKVPEGYESVTLQRRSTRPGLRWETVEVKKPDTRSGELQFRLKKPLPRRMLRVLGTKPGQLPSNFMTGVTDFQSPPGTDAGIPLGIGQPRSGNALELGAAGAVNSNADAAGGAVARTVVESDVWKLSGDRLCLFNQYRGLQVLDVADPAQPALLGTVPFPAAGEDLYELGNGHVALLANSPYLLGWNVNEPAGAEGSLVICDASAGAPVVVKALPIAGQLLESRLVGTALYVASQVQDTANDGWSYKWKIQVTGFDLSDPANPVVRNTVTLRTPKDDSYASFGAVQASTSYFMVAENTYRWDLGDTRSTVSLVDISNPDGTVALRGRAAVGGYVQDKFKLREQGGKLSAISSYLAWGEGRRQSHTRLENFDVSNASAPRRVGGLELGFGEQVHGTRFDGDRVYIVTFFRIDPLWIVDNSNPAEPEIASELELPGFSTYLAPLGDRLVSVGFLDGRVTVTLFDVADAENPSVLTQLPVTEPGAWSEANWDEKAFTVLPGEGLIMLPVSAGWRWSWGNEPTPESSGVQLVDLGRDSLTLRGRIPHGFAPRRATVHAGSVLAFSQDSLLTADITDRDAPVVTNDLQLAWRTDRVWHLGSHLVQIGGRIDGTDTVVSVSPDNAPDETISSVNLGVDVLVAADVRNGYLYVVQQEVPPPGVETFAAPSATLRIYDLTSLPQIISVGTLRTDAVNIANTWTGKILWPQDGTLVVAHGGGGGYWRGGGIFLDTPVAFASPAAGVALVDDSAFRIAPWYYPTETEKHFDQFNVTLPAAPAFVGRKTIKSKGWGQFSEPAASKGKVFVTRWVTPPVYHYGKPVDGVAVANANPAGAEVADIAPEENPFVGRYVLHVLDYSATGGVSVAAPISAPGELIGLRNDGMVIYTRGFDYDGRGIGLVGTSVIHASAFDGAKLHLITTLPSDGSDALPVDDKLFAFAWKNSPPANQGHASFAMLWRLGDDGKFHLLDEEKFDGYSPRAFGDVLFAASYSGYGGALAALDFSNPGDLKNLGRYRLPGWLWPDLTTASGSPADGLWLPFGSYGVLKVDLPK